jgi:hypothetical protein
MPIFFAVWRRGDIKDANGLTRIFHRIPAAPADSTASQALDLFGDFDVYEHAASQMSLDKAVLLHFSYLCTPMVVSRP